MDPLTRALLGGAAGSGGAEKIYIESVFSTWLYTGNGSTQTITNGIDLAGKGGLVWCKNRTTATTDHILTATPGKALKSNLTNAEQTTTRIDSFNSNGFFINNGSTDINQSSENYASWTFRKAAKFFDVVTYVGDGTSNRAISHSLGSTPGAVIVKCTSNATRWCVWHKDLGGSNYNLILNTTQSSAAQGDFSTGSASFTSTTFPVNEAGGGNTNVNGNTYVAYLFAHDAGGFGDSGNESVVKCGSYTGNGSTSGPTIDLGWEPQWLLFKRTDTTSDWSVIDNMRGLTVAGQPDKRLLANTSGAEGDDSFLAPTATGFQLTFGSPDFNANGGTYIYIAIRRGPMKTPTDATKVFSMVDRAGTSATATVTGFTNLIDTLIVRGKVNGFPANFYDRLRGATKILFSNSTVSETTDANTLTGFDVQTGYTVGGDNSGYGINYAPGGPYINWAFRRAPGFFDVVAYTGTGVARTVSHNLGVVPELMIVKARDNAYKWVVYSSGVGNTQFISLNETTAAVTSPATWNNTTPTSSVFTLGTGAFANVSSGAFIAYLFATCPGVSKCFNFTGTGTTLQINCGFTNGARFVMIKRTDSTGDWYIWDSARGIVSGNDPYLLLNSSAAEVTNTDYIDPYAAGFEISSSAPAAINANGGSYIGLAIA